MALFAAALAVALAASTVVALAVGAQTETLVTVNYASENVAATNVSLFCADSGSVEISQTLDGTTGGSLTESVSSDQVCTVEYPDVGPCLITTTPDGIGEADGPNAFVFGFADSPDGLIVDISCGATEEIAAHDDEEVNAEDAPAIEVLVVEPADEDSEGDQVDNESANEADDEATMLDEGTVEVAEDVVKGEAGGDEGNDDGRDLPDTVAEEVPAPGLLTVVSENEPPALLRCTNPDGEQERSTLVRAGGDTEVDFFLRDLCVIEVADSLGDCEVNIVTETPDELPDIGRFGNDIAISYPSDATTPFDVVIGVICDASLRNGSDQVIDISGDSAVITTAEESGITIIQNELPVDAPLESVDIQASPVTVQTPIAQAQPGTPTFTG